MTRWERFGAFPASGAVVAALQIVLVAVLVAYCVARPRGGALLAAPVVGGALLVGALAAAAPAGLVIVGALAIFVASFVVASRLDERDDELAAGKGARR